MAFGMASNLFQLSHNFLTHKCPRLSTKRFLFKQTEILWLICNDCLRPIRIFFRPCLFLCSWTFAKIMSPDQNFWPGLLLLLYVSVIISLPRNQLLLTINALAPDVAFMLQESKYALIITMLQNKCKGMIFYPNNQKKRHKKHKSATFFDLGWVYERIKTHPLIICF